MPYNALAKPVLIIDPGHGGKDPGGVSKFGHEEDWTLKISLYQYERFQELGVPVVISRATDVDLEENDRVSTVNNSGATYCLSNHLNMGGGDRAEVIHSIHDDGKLAHRIKDQLLAAGQNAVKVYVRQGSNKKDYYYMHRRTVPIVNIVEYAFLDNEADYKHFEAHWKDYAEAVVRAFCTHIGHPYKAPEQPITGIRYIYTGGFAGPALMDIHNYLRTTKHNFDVKRGPDWSLIFLVGPFDAAKPNFEEAQASILKFDKHRKFLTREEASEFKTK